MPASPLNTVGNNRSGDRPHSRVSSSQANGIASFLKYSPNEKFPSISKNVWCLSDGPTFSRSLCLPLTRMHFCEVAARVYERFSRPRNASLNWFMPALVKRSVGSSRGTSDELATTMWPFLRKYSRKLLRISRERMKLIVRLLVVPLSAQAPQFSRDDSGGEPLSHQVLIESREFGLIGRLGLASELPLKRPRDERALVEIAED